MRIEIDTKKDSTEDIQKTIDFLQKFVEAGSSSTYQDNNIPDAKPSSFNMFDASSSTVEDKKDDDDDENAKLTIEPY